MFKTVDGELKVFNKTILSTQNNLKNLQTQTANLSYYTSGGNHVNLQNVPIAQPQAVSNFTKLNNAFNVYNNNLTKSTGLQNAYIKSVGTQNQALGNYLAGLKGAPATFDGYIAALTKAKLATIGLHAASIALNMALTMGISFAIQGLITLFDNLIHRSEKIQESANNARSAIDDIKSSLDNLKTTTNDVKKRYAELAQEVDNLGKINQSQGSLSTDEYAEFLNLSNQLADLFPQLTRGYDDNGNAILSLSGNVGTIVGSLNDLVDVQQRLANLQILENMPDVWNGYINKVYDDGKINRGEYRDAIKQNKAEQDAILKMMSDLETGTTSSYNSLDSEFGAIGVEMYNAIDAALKQFNLSAPGLFRKEFTGIVGEELTHWDFSSLTREQMSAVKNALGTLADEYQKEIELTTGKLKTANAEMSGYINTWLSTEWNFNRLAPEMQNVVKDVLLNSDWISMLPDSVDASNWDEVSAWLQNNFLYAVNDIDSQQIKTALVDVFNGEFTVESLQNIIDQLIKTEGFDENNPLIIYLKTKMEGREEYEKNYDTAVNKYGAEGKAEIEKAFKKNSIDTQEELDNWIEVTKGAKDAAEAVDMYAESKKNANKTVSIGDLEKTSNNIKTLGSAFKELSENGFITTKTLGEIQTATGLSGDEWAEYENRLLNAKKGSADFNQVLSELTYKILENEFATIDLTNATDEEITAIENKIAATLRENRVENSSIIAKEYVNNLRAKSSVQAQIEKKGIDAVIEGLKDETNWCGLTANAYAQLVAKEIIFNQNDLDVSKKLTKLQSLYGMLGLVGDKWERLNNAMSGTSQQKSSANINAGIYKREGANRQYEWVYNGVSYSTEQEAYDAYMVDQVTKDIVVKNTMPIVDYSGNTKDSGSDKNKPDYEDPTDAIINRINLRSKELEQQEESIQNAIEIAELENDYKKQISLTNDKLDVQRQKVDALKTANDELHQMAEDLRNSTPDWNEEEWFDSQGNETKAYIDFINGRIDAGASKEEIEKIKDQFEKISKIKEAWVDNDEKIVDLNKEILQGEKELADLSLTNSENWISEREFYNDWDKYGDTKAQAWKRVLDRFRKEYPNETDKIKDLEKKLYDALIEQRDDYISDLQDAVDREIEIEQKRIDKLKEKNELQMSRNSSLLTLLDSYHDIQKSIAEEQHNIDKELSASKRMSEYLDEDTRKLLFNDDDYKALSETLSDIADKAATLQADYNRDILKATSKNIEEITNGYERQYELLMQQYEVEKAKLEVTKKQQQLNNVLNERNVRMYIAGQGWTWVADTQQVIQAEEELYDAQHNLNQLDDGVYGTNDEADYLKTKHNLESFTDALQTETNNLDKYMEDINNRWDNIIKGMETEQQSVSQILDEIALSGGEYIHEVVNGVGGALEDLYKDITGYDLNASYNPNIDYKSIMDTLPQGSYLWNYLNRMRNIKIDSQGLSYPKYASGTPKANRGIGLTGEEGSEYIASNGHLIPVTSPSMIKYDGSETVFSHEQVKQLYEMTRQLCNYPDWSLYGGYGNLKKAIPVSNKNITTTDNRIYFNGVEIKGEDAKELRSTLQRILAIH